ncbi:4-hydroxyphenylpyruvate dioxygenase [Bailinhaonella thermotolerans]|uniref:4-hydroxyphenylpyruvate dioxygenase n=1 Tax=Bailinhaonella thermotolerans TaxID=1070861 RepID=A0A3A4A877_9ACTN|nr:4-hydroxyphenylpyruvate dioxygenase [Bailinhaonella thermotolerans]RJL21270.1 4-hydroxyphenylpyruvate dioxygenase [Bailinhaonella thermotolerans]
MTESGGVSPFAGLTLDHVGFAVSDARQAARAFVNGYGLTPYARSPRHRSARAIAVGAGDIRMVFRQSLRSGSAPASYVRAHGDGVCDIALRARDAEQAVREAERRGAVVLSPPARAEGVVTAAILGFGDVRHTFIERAAGVDERALPGLTPVAAAPAAGPDPGLRAVDHFAVCLEPGRLEATTDFYRRVLDFDVVFEERIVVGRQAMDSKVVQSPGGGLTLTLIEPDISREPGQIDSFLRGHGGAGVQHIALATDDIVTAVRAMTRRGVDFLDAPDSYYTLLAGRLEPVRHTVAELRETNVLVDQDHDGQLFQLFTRSVHPRKTLFMEVIERMGARTFGSGNIRALYEAVELQRAKDAA